MKVVVAMDSFKGSLSSMEAALAVKDGINKVYKDAEVLVKEIADGGEGTTLSIVNTLNGTFHNCKVVDPLGREITGDYGIITRNNKKIVVMEMAQAAGITLVSKNERNPLISTTYGVGLMIKDAINKGYRDFLIGIGGSATNDGGIGMLKALGYEFLDKNGQEIKPGPEGIKDLKVISNKKLLKEIKECNFTIACDVKNPLCGVNGASMVFAGQKGADAKMASCLDELLFKFSQISCEFIKKDYSNIPGAGAAGGLGFAFVAFLNGTLKNGIEIILDTINLESDIRDCDIVVTGEGSLDSQTVMGKVPLGVAKISKKYNKPVIAIVGSIKEGANVCNLIGIDAYFSIINECCTLDNAICKSNSIKNIKNTTEQIFRLYNLKK